MDVRTFNKITENSVFLIEYDISEDDIGVGTGFFVKFSTSSENKPIYGLITCQHVLKSKHLNSGFEFKIIFKNINKEFKIKLNNSQFIFTSKLLDITFIQFTDELIDEFNLDRENFLTPYCIDVPMDGKKNKNILVIQYPQGETLKFAVGDIDSINGFNYRHSISTQQGSSGSPLVSNNYEILGVHKAGEESSNEDDNINYATKFSIIHYAICTLYNNRNRVGMDKAKLPPKKLSDEELEELKNMGLESKSNKVFYLVPEMNSSSEFSDLYFYRTNHAWYFTKDLNDIDEKEKYKIKNLKRSQWTVINSFDEVNHFRISHHQKIVINFLLFSGFKYLID